MVNFLKQFTQIFFKSTHYCCLYFHTDIILSSAGWVSINLPPTETAHFYAWTPEKRGIFVRKPALLPHAADLYRGKRKKYTPAYSQKEPSEVKH